MNSPPDARKLMINIWWGMSVPFVVLYDVRVGLLAPTLYYESQLSLGVRFLFPIALYFSIVWIVMRIVMARSISWKTADKVMIGLAIVASAFGAFMVIEPMMISLMR